MLLTKFSHSCVRITDGDRAVVIDPGTFSEVETALDGIDSVLITHEHPDHVDISRLGAVAAANPELRVWAPLSVVSQLGSVAALAGRLTAVGPGESFVAGGLAVQAFGGQHALIHSSIPVISNAAFLIEGMIYHPGDSYVVPTQPVEVALIPLHAPWARIAETMDFAVSLRPSRAIGIHDALLAPTGLGMYRDRVGAIAGEHGTEFLPLDAGESLQL